MDALTRLRAANAAIRDRDRPLADELTELTDGPTPEGPGGEIQLETIVLRTGRPVLAIKQDEAQLVFDDADSAVWNSRLRRHGRTSCVPPERSGGSRPRATAWRGSALGGSWRPTRS